MSATWINKQPSNINFLSTTQFKFEITNCPAVQFFCQSANVPGITLSTAEQSTRYNAIPIPGDEVSYNDLNIKFIVDENITNYLEIHRWIRHLGHPYNLQELYTAQNNTETSLLYYTGYAKEGSIYSDASLTILNSNFIPKFKIIFKDIFPIYISDMVFDSSTTELNYIIADATFKYTIYDIVSINNNSQ